MLVEFLQASYALYIRLTHINCYKMCNMIYVQFHIFYFSTCECINRISACHAIFLKHRLFKNFLVLVYF